MSRDANNMEGLRVLDNATRHLAKQFSLTMPPAEAKAHFDARALLFRCANQIFREQGCPITNEEIEGARIIEREFPHAN